MATKALIVFERDSSEAASNVAAYDLKSVAIDRYADLKNDPQVRSATLYWVEVATSFDKTLPNALLASLDTLALFGRCYSCGITLNNVTTGVIGMEIKGIVSRVCADCASGLAAQGWNEVYRAR